MHEYFIKKRIQPVIEQHPSNSLGICVVLPSYNETNLEKSLKSLAECQLPAGTVEVIVVVNHPENSALEIIEVSQQSVKIVENFNTIHGSERLQFLSVQAFDLPRKQAGVGLARQIGMDEAAYRLYAAGNPNGIISCFDADATCMNNYLAELENLWKINPRTAACSIKYAHSTYGAEYPNEIYEGIAGYELHLRYYNQASRHIGFPFSFHTIGSSMACSASAYLKFGGMNRHQAGEDFYFLQKIIPHGNFEELNTTCVFPSPRPSDRVPFGTGRAMLKYLSNTEEGIKTYNLQSFLDLEPFFNMVDDFWNLDEDQISGILKLTPKPLYTFLLENNAAKEILRARNNAAHRQSFRKRFFLWFDAFMLLKYLNCVNEKDYQRQPIHNEAMKLGKLISLPIEENSTTAELLTVFRQKDLEKWNPTL